MFYDNVVWQDFILLPINCTFFVRPNLEIVKLTLFMNSHFYLILIKDLLSNWFMSKIFFWKLLHEKDFLFTFQSHNTDGQNAIEINSKGVMLTNQHLECQNTEKCQFAEKLRLYKQLCNFRALFRPIFYFNNERKMHFLYLYTNILL